MTTSNEILKMTHQELLVASAEIKQMYREAKIMQNLTLATNLISQGYKHIQFNSGCIQKKKETDHLGKFTFYVIKNGIGTGKVNHTFKTIKECLTHIDGYGWGDIQSYK